jgi:hypothetical protein
MKCNLNFPKQEEMRRDEMRQAVVSWDAETSKGSGGVQRMV